MGSVLVEFESVESSKKAVSVEFAGIIDKEVVDPGEGEILFKNMDP